LGYPHLRFPYTNFQKPDLAFTLLCTTSDINWHKVKIIIDWNFYKSWLEDFLHKFSKTRLTNSRVKRVDSRPVLTGFYKHSWGLGFRVFLKKMEDFFSFESRKYLKEVKTHKFCLVRTLGFGWGQFWPILGDGLKVDLRIILNLLDFLFQIAYKIFLNFFHDVSLTSQWVLKVFLNVFPKATIKDQHKEQLDNNDLHPHEPYLNLFLK
jgi:hypothetical protein